MILKSKIDGEYVVSKKWRRAPLKDAQKAIFDGERARKNGEPLCIANMFSIYRDMKGFKKGIYFTFYCENAG